MQRKGQLAIIIIVVIVIIVVIGLFFGFRNKNIQPDIQVVDAEVQEVYDFVVDCIEETGEEAVYEVGRQGGYYEIPENTFIIGFPYYVFEGENKMPTKQLIEQEIAKYVDENLEDCIIDFVDFPDYNINSGEIASRAVINQKNVEIDVFYDLDIRKENTKFSLKNFDNIIIPIRLGEIYDIAEQVVGLQLEDLNNICVSCLIEIAEENDLFIPVESYTENIFIYHIIEDLQNPEKFNYDFVFAVELKGEEE